MYYWNQKNYESLKEIGEQYSSLQGYELFGKYCLLKEQGLKKQAVSTIKEFVAKLKNESVQVQRDMTVELSSLRFWNGETHQLISYPLQIFLKEVLSAWASEDINNATPHRWLGYISGDLESYQRALDINPQDDICITKLAQAHLNDVDFQTHHLSESQLLGELCDARDSIGKAEVLIDTLSTDQVKRSMNGKLNYYKRLLNSWEEYCNVKESKESFPEWCALKGEKYNFSSITYYDR